MNEEIFLPLTEQIGISETNYSIQLGYINHKTTLRLFKEQNLVSQYIPEDVLLDEESGLPALLTIKGWIIEYFWDIKYAPSHPKNRQERHRLLKINRVTKKAIVKLIDDAYNKLKPHIVPIEKFDMASFIAKNKLRMGAYKKIKPYTPPYYFPEERIINTVPMYKPIPYKPINTKVLVGRDQVEDLLRTRWHNNKWVLVRVFLYPLIQIIFIIILVFLSII